MSDEITTMRVRIEGRVQGVGFRAYTVGQAAAFNLKGWVRNRLDGSVEMLVSGPDADVKSFIARCVQGPPGAQVANFTLQPTEPPGEPGFTQRATM